MRACLEPRPVGSQGAFSRTTAGCFRCRLIPSTAAPRISRAPQNWLSLAIQCELAPSGDVLASRHEARPEMACDRLAIFSPPFGRSGLELSEVGVRAPWVRPARLRRQCSAASRIGDIVEARSFGREEVLQGHCDVGRRKEAEVPQDLAAVHVHAIDGEWGERAPRADPRFRSDARAHPRRDSGLQGRRTHVGSTLSLSSFRPSARTTVVHSVIERAKESLELRHRLGELERRPTPTRQTCVGVT